MPFKAKHSTEAENPAIFPLAFLDQKNRYLLYFQLYGLHELSSGYIENADSAMDSLPEGGGICSRSANDKDCLIFHNW